MVPSVSRPTASLLPPSPASLSRADVLLLRLHVAVSAQDFRQAAALRDELDMLALHASAAAAKPRYAPGLVVTSKSGKAGWRGVVCSAAVAAGGGWYRVAVDRGDKARVGLRGGNVRLVREEEVVPVRADVAKKESTVVVEHPVVGTIFREELDVSDDGFLFFRRQQ
jgi:hypothetical protein